MYVYVYCKCVCVCARARARGYTHTRAHTHTHSYIYPGKPHDFGWRDFVDISIKWRQISEPNDPVFWSLSLPLAPALVHARSLCDCGGDDWGCTMLACARCACLARWAWPFACARTCTWFGMPCGRKVKRVCVCVCVCVNPGKLARNVCRIDLLAPEAFAEGFGLQTPMVTGQMNVVRYYPYFTRALEVVKKLVADSGTVFCSDDGSGGLCCLAV